MFPNYFSTDSNNNIQKSVTFARADRTVEKIAVFTLVASLKVVSKFILTGIA